MDSTELPQDSGSAAPTCSASDTPETDRASYEATPRTVGKWIVPLAKAKKLERERDKLGALLRARALEERSNQAASVCVVSVNMHAYAANRLESVLLALGLSISSLNATAQPPTP